MREVARRDVAVDDLLRPRSFDVVLCGDLVEHLRDPGAVARPAAAPAPRTGTRARPHDCRTSRTGRCGSALAGRWRYTDRGILRPDARASSRARRWSRRSRRRLRVVELDHTAPVARSSGRRLVERVAHAVAGSPPVALRVPVPARGDAAVISARHPGQGRRRTDLGRCLDGHPRQGWTSPSRSSSSTRARPTGARSVERGGARRARDPRRREFGHGRSRNLGAASPRATSSWSRRRTRSRTTRRWLGERCRGGRSSGRPRSRAPTAASCRIEDARPPERFFLDFLYGPEPRTSRLATGEELDLRGDACSPTSTRRSHGPRRALPVPRRPDDERGPGWSRRLDHAGPALVYEPRGAAVDDSHAYTSIGTAFRRFFDSGVSAEHVVRRGRRLARRAPARRLALRAAKSSRGSGAQAVRAGSRTRSSTSSASSRGCSSGSTTRACRVR